MSYTKTDIKNFIDACNNLELDKKDPTITFPQSLPICVIEAVFSMGANSTSARNAWMRYMERNELNYDSSTGKVTPEHTISDFLAKIESVNSYDDAAQNMLNRQRTSSRNGILKAEAAYEVAIVLKKHGIDTLQDFSQKAYRDSTLDNDIRKVKGQSSGIMLKYLYMLAGDSNQAKPDRMLMRYIKSVISAANESDIPGIMEKAVAQLKPNYPDLTVRLLDYLIWEYQRAQ